MHIERNEQQENHEPSQRKKSNSEIKLQNCEENRRMCRGKDLPFQIRLFSEANVKIRRIIPNNNNKNNKINKKKKKKKNRRKKTRVEY